MKLRQSLLFGAILGLFAASQAAAAPAAPGQACSSEQEAANLKLVEKLAPAAPPTAEDQLAMMHPDFIQHSPEEARFLELNNARGKAGLELFLRAMNKVGHPASAPHNMTYSNPVIIVKCDLIFVMTEWQLPDPRNPGKTYAANGFNLYRIKDGKVIEHWDDHRLAATPPPYSVAPFEQLVPGSGKGPPAPAR